MNLKEFFDEEIEDNFDKPVFGISKTCIDCKLTLPLSFYSSKRSNLDRADCRCRKCRSKRMKEMNEIRKTAPAKPSNCECCGKEVTYHPTRRKMGICMDHDPDTKRFRGWICNECNLGIGMLGDRLENIKNVYEYMIRTSDGRSI